MAQHIDGKKSAAAIRYRLDRLVGVIDDLKIHDATRQDVIAAVEKIAQGERRPAY